MVCDIGGYAFYEGPYERSPLGDVVAAPFDVKVEAVEGFVAFAAVPKKTFAL